MLAIALRYDLRAPSWAATQHPELYRIMLDQIRWVEERGAADIVSLSEHHGNDDGFMSSPFTVAAAIVGATDHIPVTIAAALLPLHDPIRLAEQIATVDLMARGRVSFVAGAGYATHEFEMAGVDPKRRGTILEETVEVMRRAWTGEPFEWQGRTVRVTPRPFSQPHPPIFVGGSSKAAARRAARLHVPFFPAVNDPELRELYEQECAAVGFAFGFCLMPNGPGFVHVTEDPEKDWAEISRYAWHDADTYRSWQTPGVRSAVATKASTIEELREEGIYWVVTPDECVDRAVALGENANIVLHPLMCGIPAELGWRSLELFADRVLPRLRPS